MWYKYFVLNPSYLKDQLLQTRWSAPIRLYWCSVSIKQLLLESIFLKLPDSDFCIVTWNWYQTLFLICCWAHLITFLILLSNYYINSHLPPNLSTGAFVLQQNCNTFRFFPIKLEEIELQVTFHIVSVLIICLCNNFQLHTTIIEINFEELISRFHSFIEYMTSSQNRDLLVLYERESFLKNDSAVSFSLPKSTWSASTNEFYFK